MDGPLSSKEALRVFPWVICRLDSAENAVVGRDLAFRPKSRKHNTWNDRETRSLVSWDRPSQEHFRAGARPEGPTITHEEPAKKERDRASHLRNVGREAGGHSTGFDSESWSNPRTRSGSYLLLTIRQGSEAIVSGRRSGTAAVRNDVTNAPPVDDAYPLSGRVLSIRR